MKGRKFTSIGLALTAILTSTTGIILLFFKDFFPSFIKNYVEHIHEWISFIFVLFIFMHTIYNIRPLGKYFLGNIFGISKEFIANFTIVIIITTFLVVSANIRNDNRSKSIYPSIEDIPLSFLLENNGIDYDNAIENLEERGYKIPNDELTLGSLAKANNTKAKVLYSVMAFKN